MATIITGSSQGVERRVRPPALAGTWYPGQPDELSTLIATLQGRSKPVTEAAGSPPIRAVILPHAGYRFSGETALAGLQPLKGATFKRVIVLGPSHQKSFMGLVLPRATHFRTPLGEIPLDAGAMARLANHPMFHTIPGVHDQEHSIEIQLPLLQTVLAQGFQLLPLLVGQMDAMGFAQAAEALRPLCDDKTLLVISGDFTHYGNHFNYQPFPVDAKIADNLKTLDMGAVAKILSRDPQGFLDYKQQSGITACAFGPVMVLLNLISHPVEPRLVQYRTSGSENGDFSHSVSYVAMTFHATQNLAEMGPEMGVLSKNDMKRLHTLAITAVMAAVQSQGAVKTLEEGADLEELQERFGEPSGAFVTLKRSGRLRGCIGQLQPVQPLYKAVMENAAHAALRDSRFKPVASSELDGMELEVSVLSPMRPIASWENFEVGRQGVVLSKQGRRAVFLPEVAVEQGWSREETLNHLAQKAGLPPDAWRQGATFEVFTSQTYTAPLRLPTHSNGDGASDS